MITLIRVCVCILHLVNTFIDMECVYLCLKFETLYFGHIHSSFYYNMWFSFRFTDVCVCNVYILYICIWKVQTRLKPFVMTEFFRMWNIIVNAIVHIQVEYTHLSFNFVVCQPFRILLQLQHRQYWNVNKRNTAFLLLHRIECMK